MRCGLALLLLSLTCSCGGGTAQSEGPSAEKEAPPPAAPAQALVASLIEGPWMANHASQSEQTPAVVIGRARAAKGVTLSVEPLVRQLEIQIMGTGKMVLLASKEQRKAIRAEQQHQAAHASDETGAPVGMEAAADYMLSIKVDKAGNKPGDGYKVTGDLRSLQDSAGVWSADVKAPALVFPSRDAEALSAAWSPADTEALAKSLIDELAMTPAVVARATANKQAVRITVARVVGDDGPGAEPLRAQLIGTLSAAGAAEGAMVKHTAGVVDAPSETAMPADGDEVALGGGPAAELLLAVEIHTHQVPMGPSRVPVYEIAARLFDVAQATVVWCSERRFVTKS